MREAECEELVLAAAWADVHYLDKDGEDYRPLVQRSCAWGGQGCPPVAEHCAHELGTLRGTGAVAAWMLIADALDLRHRGQTGQHNLGPFTRPHHRVVTFAAWRRRQPDPGTYLFRSPNGHAFLTTNHGTLSLGRTAFTHALWRGDRDAAA